MSVCLCVCQHDNFRTSKGMMMKLGGRCSVQKSRPSSNLGSQPPGVRTPKNVTFARTLGKSAAGGLVRKVVFLAAE